MPLFSVHLLFSLEVDVSDPPLPVRELAVHVLSAVDESGAKLRGETIGRTRESIYKNGAGETVRNIFKRVVEIKELIDDHLFDGMEVAYWMWDGDRFIVEESWIKEQGD